MYKILKKRKLNPVTHLFVVHAPLVARRAEPGQFVILRVRPEGERIPLTICDYDRSEGTITIVAQEVGKTTRLLGRLEEGDSLVDFVGPLGKPAPLPDEGHVVAIGGGIGAAPVYPKVRAMHERGVRVTGIIGARTAELLILEEEMAAVCDRLFVATDDGTKGYHGFVTGVLERLLREEAEDIDEVLAVGPMVMMRAVADMTRPYGIRTMISVDPIMVDGTGMCGACRLTVGGKTRFACVDGPTFDAHEVDFEEAIRRSRMYVEEQQLALHTCSCGGDEGCR